MAILRTATKGKIVKTAVKNPGLLRAGAKSAKPAVRLGFKVGKPLAKRRVRRGVAQLGRSAEQIDSAAQMLGDVLAHRAPELAYRLGLAEPPKPKLTAPAVAIGILIGAGATYAVINSRGGASAGG